MVDPEAKTRFLFEGIQSIKTTFRLRLPKCLSYVNDIDVKAQLLNPMNTKSQIISNDY